MKINKTYIIGFIITLLLEVLVFNFSSVSSLFNKEINLDGRITMDYSEWGPVVRIDIPDEEIKNIYFDVEVTENAPVNYDISLTDEGNYYDYYFPQGTLYHNTGSSFYRNIHTYGKAHTMSITFSDGGSGFGLENFSVNSIRLNVRRPLFFNLIRVAVVYLIFLFLYGLRDGGKLITIPINTVDKSKEQKRQLCITLLCIAIVIFGGLFWSGSHKLFDESTKPHHQQYKELADALISSEVSLPIEPSSGLKSAPNPYDTIYLQANGIDYKADYAYYEGKYYVYFGVVPAVLLYMPFKMITGKDLPNHYAVFLFYAGFVIGTFGLYYLVAKKYFTKLSYAAYLILSVATATCGTFAYLYFTADLYSVPVMAAMCFTFLGLFLWLWGKESKNVFRKYIGYIIGSLCMALVAGSRPQFLIFSFLGIPIFAKDILGKGEKKIKERAIDLAALLLPYVPVAIGIMYYNYARFGSVMDFGATYSLTNNDMNLRGFNFERILISLITFCFGMPKVNGIFPYINSAELEYTYLGRMVTEHFLGGIFVISITSIAVFMYGHYRNEIKGKSLGIIFGMLVFFAVITGVLDAEKAGVLQRYMADMALGIMAASAIVWAAALEKGNRLTFAFLKLLTIAQLVISFFIICNTASGITLKVYNPELFGRLLSIFVF